MRIDGKLIAYLVEVTSEPCLPRSTIVQILRHGLKHSEQLIEEVVRAEACESVMRKARPDLYQKEELPWQQ